MTIVRTCSLDMVLTVLGIERKISRVMRTWRTLAYSEEGLARLDRDKLRDEEPPIIVCINAMANLDWFLVIILFVIKHVDKQRLQ